MLVQTAVQPLIERDFKVLETLEPGMHYRILTLPGSVPDVLVGDKCYWRAFQTNARKTFKIGLLEVHSTSSNYTDGVIHISETTGPDLSRELHPAMMSAIQGGVSVTLIDQTTMKVEFISMAAGLFGSFKTVRNIEGVNVRYEGRIIIPWRAPYMFYEIVGTPLDARDFHTIYLPTVNGFVVEHDDDSPVYACGIAQQVWSDAVLIPKNLTEDLETTRAVWNSRVTPLMVSEWKDRKFMGYRPIALDKLYGKGNLIALPSDPDQPGAHGEYGVTAYPFLFDAPWNIGPNRQTPDRSAISSLMIGANTYCDAQYSWFKADGKYAPWWSMSSSSKLTFEEGYPWIDNRSDPYDDLGYNMERGSHFYVDLNHQPADSEHISLAGLCTAYMMTGKLRYQIIVEAQARILPYTRAYQVTLTDPRSDWTPGGRRGARPWLAIYNLANVCMSPDLYEMLQSVSEAWAGVHARSIRKKNIPLNMPQIFSGGPVGNVLTSFENGQLAFAAMTAYVWHGGNDALFVALIEGRCCCSQLHFIDDQWQSAYNTPITGDGSLPTSGITYASSWLKRWVMAGITAYGFALEEAAKLDEFKFINFHDFGIWKLVGDACTMDYRQWDQLYEGNYYNELAAFFNMSMQYPVK